MAQQQRPVQLPLQQPGDSPCSRQCSSHNSHWQPRPVAAGPYFCSSHKLVRFLRWHPDYNHTQSDHAFRDLFSHMSIRSSVHLSIHASIHLSIREFIRMSDACLSTSIHEFIRMSDACLSTSIHMTVRMSIHICISIHMCANKCL